MPWNYCFIWNYLRVLFITQNERMGTKLFIFYRNSFSPKKTRNVSSTASLYQITCCRPCGKLSKKSVGFFACVSCRKINKILPTLLQSLLYVLSHILLPFWTYEIWYIYNLCFRIDGNLCIFSVDFHAGFS